MIYFLEATMFMKGKELNSNELLKLIWTRLLPTPFPSRPSKSAPVLVSTAPSGICWRLDGMNLELDRC
jgi:hypothetical protein